MPAVGEMIKAILGLAHVIETLAEVRDGRRTGVRVQPAHLIDADERTYSPSCSSSARQVTSLASRVTSIAA